MKHKTRYQSLAEVLHQSRVWHRHQQLIHDFHPIIEKAIELGHVPQDWHNLVLQWPHRATQAEFKGKVAYIREEQHTKVNLDPRYTVTTLGKYLARHFPNTPDHVIRDLVALDAASGCMLVHTRREMIHHVQRGPRSCMQLAHCNEDDHPYNAYGPQYGWHMAVRMEGGETVGRCMCNDNRFVRSYKQTGEHYSPPDEILEAWLVQEGYQKVGGWSGYKLEYHPGGDEFLVPYIDGNCQRVSEHHDRSNGCVLIITYNGEWECTNQDGSPSRLNYNCAECGDTFHEDDLISIGFHGESSVCEHCLCGYVSAIGRRGDEYYVRDDDCVEVDGTYYENRYLSDNGIIELEDGCCAHADDCVEVDGEWRLLDDCVEVDGEWRLRDDCVEVDGEWRLLNDCVEVDGEWRLLTLEESTATTEGVTT